MSSETSKGLGNQLLHKEQDILVEDSIFPLVLRSSGKLLEAPISDIWNGIKVD